MTVSIPGKPCADGALPVLTADAEVALKVAHAAVEAVEAKVREAKRAADAEINDRFRAERQAALAVKGDAQRALTAAMDRQPEHPWTGRKVYRMVPQGRVWDRRAPLRIEGVVETRRSATGFPLNTADYRLPRLGDGFVRLLKADGTPGAKFETLDRHTSWKLCEGQEVTPPNVGALAPHAAGEG